MRFTNWPFSRKYTLYAVHIAFLKPALVNCTVFFLGPWSVDSCVFSHTSPEIRESTGFRFGMFGGHRLEI